MCRFVLSLVMCAFALPARTDALAWGRDSEKCRPLAIDQCANIGFQQKGKGYATTSGVDQAYVDKVMTDLFPLVSINCAPELETFFCARFAPMCFDNDGVNSQSGSAGLGASSSDSIIIVRPCRDLCLKVYNICKQNIVKIIPDFNLTEHWPDSLRCDDENNFPLRTTERVICMPVDHINSSSRNKFNVDAVKRLHQAINPAAADTRRITPHTPHPIVASGNKGRSVCGDRFVAVQAAHGNTTCALRCGVDVLFRQSDRQFAKVWIIVFAALCALSTSFTVLTFLVDTTRFKYPERPIVFLALCFCFYSCGFIISTVVGYEQMACDGQAPNQYVAEESYKKGWCVVVFLLTYYFGLSSAFWWTMLSFAWYLAAAKKWSAEAIDAVCSYFHIVSWALPAVMTTCVFIFKKINADELTGLCSVGAHDADSLTYFSLIPLAVLLALGAIFTVAGFVSLVNIRKRLKRSEAQSIRRLEKLMAKIGIFSVLYALPTASIIGCYFYERHYRDVWNRLARERSCLLVKSQPDEAGMMQVESDCSLAESIPHTAVFVLKIFMQLVVGITSGMWVWSSKTWHSWQRFLRCPHGSHYCQKPSGMQTLPGQLTALKTAPSYLAASPASALPHHPAFASSVNTSTSHPYGVHQIVPDFRLHNAYHFNQLNSSPTHL